MNAADGGHRSGEATLPSRPWRAWKALTPIAVAVAVAVVPSPGGLPPHAWYFFALFSGALVALVLEPVPNAAVGVIGVAIATAMSRWVLFSPAERARPGFNASARALEWALSGFQNPAVWLAFSAFMFALGYEKTALGRRIALWIVKSLGKGTLRLGYAVTLVDLVLAPFTPSNTARSAGIVYPILRSVPHLYGSEPNQPSARRIGSYLLWTGFAASCVTSSLFLTALAPNLIAADLVRRMAGIEIGWMRWFATAAAFGLPLLAALPLLGFALVPPEIRASPEVPRWAADELERLGPLSLAEVVFALLVGGALVLWVVGGSFIHPATVALLAIALMLVTRIASWEEMAGHRPAWDMLFRLGTLLTLADGLNRTGFVGWFAAGMGRQLAHLPAMTALVGLVAAYYLFHYLFATTTAHAAAVLPVMLGVGLAIPGLRVEVYAMLLALSHGLMGVISPYATGPAPVYHGSGYLPTGTFWRLGATFGLVFLAALLLLGLPAALLLAPGAR